MRGAQVESEPMADASPRPTLAELVDLEAGLARLDAHADDAAAAGRAVCAAHGLEARAARRRAESDRDWRLHLIRAWLTRLRARESALPGQALAGGLHVAGRLLVVVGLLLGGATAAAVLASPVGEPINLWKPLGILVLLQVLLLVLLVLMLGAGAARGRVWVSGFQRLVAAIAASRFVGRLTGAAPEAWRTGWQGLEDAARSTRARGSLRAGLERWLLFRIAQAFGVAFHVGVAAVFVAMVLFSDLAFAWSTTPAGVDAGFLSGLTQALATPWAWLLPQAAPGVDAVAATQWDRLEGVFLSEDAAFAARAAADWWLFLLVAQLVWGLLPRLAAWAFGAWKVRGALAARSFDDAACHRLFDAMFPAAASGWQHPTPESVRGALVGDAAAATAHAGAAHGTAAGAAEAGRPAASLVWGDFPHDADALCARLTGRFGWQAAPPRAAGGADEAVTAAALDDTTAAARRTAADAPPAVVLFAEAGEGPDKRLLRALRRLRAALGSEAALLVALLDADAEALGLWRGYLDRAGDPALRVEALP